MSKKIYMLTFLLVSAILVKAQNYPKVIGYEAKERVETNDGFSVSLSGGAPFATTWKSALPDGTNFAMSGMRHDILYLENAFDKNLFASKGYYGDYVELKWDLIRYADKVSGFKIFRKVLGSSDDSVQVANLASDSRNWRDEYAESGLMYKYFLFAEGIFPTYQKLTNYIDGVGFRVPYGRISGRVTYEGGAAVEGVSIIAETEDNFSGSSIYLNGTDAYLAISPELDDPLFKLDTAMTFQAWYRPDGAAGTQTLFEKQGQYKLSYSSGNIRFTVAGTQNLDLPFTEKTDTFFHVTAMRTSDSLKLFVVYDEQTSFTVKEELSAATTANNNPVFIGKDNAETAFFKGWVDEVKIWHKSFSEEEILKYAGVYFAGTEDNLSAYYRMNEGIGEHFYDLSRKGFNFNENHGYIHSTAVWDNSVIPFSKQLAVKGITDINGNYIIAGIPYSTDGSVYSFTPSFGVHTFDPTQQILFLGPGATSHSSVDFVDVASFPVTGEVYYRDTYFPVEGVTIKIDGQTAVTSEGNPIVTDATGKFTVDVPIGQHFIQLYKYGHGFENNGRFPAAEGTFHDFQQPYTFQTRFQDTTLIKVIGKVVGGPVQASKPKGLGKTTNNIGNGKIVFGTQKGYDLAQGDTSNTWENEMYEDNMLKDKGDTKFTVAGTAPKQIEIEPDPATGEFFAYLLPEKYVIKSITAGTYTYPDEFHSVVDLTSAHISNTEIDSVVIGEIISPSGDTIYDYRFDSVQYRKNIDLIYRVNPTLSVTAKDGSTAFWEQTVKAKDGTEVPVTDASGTPLTKFPILKQRNPYEIKISVFEQYVNSDNGGATDNVPVTDGNVEIINALAIDDSRKLFQISNTGIVNYSFAAGLPNTVGDFTNTMSIIAYTGNGGTIQTPWTYNQAAPNVYSGPFKAYVFGGMPTGNNFVTTGPSKVDMILRDPPGSASYSYYEVGRSVSETNTYTVSNEQEGMENIKTQMGGKVVTFAGVGAGVITTTEIMNEVNVGLTHSETWVDNNTTVTTKTVTKRWETSPEQDFVGHLGDIFIGHSTNIVYGISKFLDLIPESDCVGCVDGTGTYDIGIHKGLRISPEFGTGFQYSLNHIKNYLIPNLQMLRNIYLQNSPFHSSVHPVGHDDYGTANSDTLTRGIIVSGNDTTLTYTNGDSYNYELKIWQSGGNWPSTTTHFVDSVHYYNQQIKSWEQILARNEREKVKAKLINNLSFDAGTVYENSVTYDSTETNTNTFEFSVGPVVAGQTGTKVMGAGVTVEFNESYTNRQTDESGTETTNSVTFGYVLNDPDEGDYFSLDVKNPPTQTGPIFALRGGQSQCPHEDAILTEYYQPGTVISEAVMQREVPDIACEEPVQVNVPEDQAAIFQVELRNISETDDDVWFMVSVDQASNQDGAKVSLDGHSISNGRVIFIPGGETQNKLITIEKIDPAVNDYEDIGIIMHSVCQFDPGNNWPDITDTVKVTARFKPVCSGVDLTSPDDLWVINTNTSPADEISAVIDNYNLAHTGFESVIFQYKPTSTSQWINDKYFFVNEADYNASTASNKEWIDGAPNLAYQFDMSSLQDRNYQLRAITTCADGTTNESLILSGIKDTKRPKIFGTPQPGDGILSPGDDVMLTFDETIEASLLLSSNFSVRGELNGAQLRHNSALYFDGIDDYAAVNSGVNLQDKSFAIEFWTKRANLNPGVIFDQGQIKLGFDAANRLYVTLGSQTQSTSHLYDFTDKWIHITASFDYETGMLNLYSAYDGHNAIEFEDVNFSTTFIGNGKMTIGKDADSSNPYNGFLHDLRIWEKTIGYGTANANMLVSMNGDEIGLGGMWPMDEAHGNYAQDLSRAHHAMLAGASWKVFPTGQARNFDGTAHIDFPAASSVIITDEMDFTLEFWFKATPGQTNTVMFSNGKGDGSDGAAAIPDIWIAGINGDGDVYAKNNGISITALNEDYLDNKWHHYALILNRNGNTSLYIDGTLREYKHSSNFGGLKGAEMTIGASRHYTNGTPYTNHFIGKVDEFRIWKLARTRKLLGMDMNAKLTGEEKGLVAYYPFDKYDINLILQPTLDDCDIVDFSGNPTGNTATATGGSYEATDVPNIKDARPVQNLAFNWVVNDNRIIINLDEPAELIEKCVIEFTADRVEDMRENRMASPVTWTAYIKKNTVIWDESVLNFEKKLYEPLSFQVDVLNIGGVEQNYEINNLPAWLSADFTQGSLAPDSRKTITFTVSEAVNIGDYDVSVFLTSDFGYNEKIELNLKVYETPPVWELDPDDYQYSMSVIAQFKIDGIFSTDTDDRVGAFVNGECRGVANLQYLEDYDMFEAFLNIYSNTESGENVLFKIWNASEGKVHDNVSPDYQFELNAIHGTPAAPVVLETTNSYNRSIKLENGWKWISFNLNDPNLTDVNEMFADISAEAGNQIKGQTVFDNYGNSSGWSGSLSNSGGFQVEQMYMVKIGQKDTLHFSGGKYNPLAVPISLNQGWNWIGFTPQVNISVNDAFGNYNASGGDMVKSQYAFSIYDAAMGWLGSLEYLTPGQGYMYKNEGAAGSLIYPVQGLDKSFPDDSKTPDIPGWDLQAENYRFNMSIIGRVENLNQTVTENHIIGAFAGEECRGIAKPVRISNELLYFITVYANASNENISFRLIDINSNQIFGIEEQLLFVPDNLTGELSNPQPLTIKEANSVHRLSGIAISVYPNPTEGKVQVVSSKKALLSSETLVTVTDITGKEVLLKQIDADNTEIDLTNYGPGVYFFKIRLENKVFTEKVVVK